MSEFSPFLQDVILFTITLLSATMILCVIAGPMSGRPVMERIFVWLVDIGMIGASLARLGTINITYAGGSSGWACREVGIFLATTSRVLMIVVCVYFVYKWHQRCRKRPATVNKPEIVRHTASVIRAKNIGVLQEN